MTNVIFKIGTWEQYQALESKDQYTLYWLVDVQRVYKGDVLFAVGADATAAMAGLLSAEDKAKLDKIVVSSDGDMTSIDLSALDASIKIVDTEDGKAIGVGLSAVAKNALELKDDGLYVDISGKVDEVITDANGGQALIQNEVSGGGAKFWHQDGSQAFVGVNNGGLDGLMAQIYADKQVDGKWVGSRINVYHDHIYYTSLAAKEAGKANNDADCEIATKGDISALSDTLDELAAACTWGDM